MACAEAGAASTMKQQCTSSLTLSPRVSPPFVSNVCQPRLSRPNLSISLSVQCSHSITLSLWASIILSFFPIPIFNLSLCSAPFLFFKPVIHSFLPLPSIPLCLCSCIASLLKLGPQGCLSVKKSYNGNLDKSGIWVVIVHCACECV